MSEQASPIIPSEAVMRFRKALRRVFAIIAAGGLAIIASTVIFVMLMHLWTVIEGRYHQRPFDGAAWRGQQGIVKGDWPPRLCMIDDLLERNLLAGKTVDETIALLGPPDSRAVMLEAQEPEMEYFLGPERSAARFDWEKLLLKFGKDGRLISARIGTT